jgi:putative hydrolase of the HAD superfamily
LVATDLIRGIITAGLEVKQAEKLIRLGIYQFFSPSAIFISDQIGISKPNPKLYQRACSELNISPAEAMYVGDNPISDIDPPNKIGMITVLIRRTRLPGEQAGKYQLLKSRTRPHQVIRDFKGLTAILKKHYGVRPV